MPQKYVIKLKYLGLPEFTFNTTANSDEEAIGEAKKQIIKEFPKLMGQDHLEATVVKSNDPY